MKERKSKTKAEPEEDEDDIVVETIQTLDTSDYNTKVLLLLSIIFIIDNYYYTRLSFIQRRWINHVILLEDGFSDPEGKNEN